MSKHTRARIVPILTVLAVVLLTAPARGQGAGKKVNQAVEAANRTAIEALAAGDAAKMATLYTEDGQLLPPGGDAVSGAAAIEDYWNNVVQTGVTGLTLETV